MTDGEGRLLWFGNYGGWSKLTKETSIANAHQPFRLQNQYCDGETGLHYNFSRYYDPHSGCFVMQNPIGLWGRENLYILSPNSQMWIDPLGLSPIIPIGMAIAAALGGFGIKLGTKALSKAKNIRRTKHVNNRHIDRTKYPGRCSTNPNRKSKFKKPSMRIKLEDATLASPDKVIQQGNRLQFKKDFGREIGTNGETELRVIPDPIKKRIIIFFLE